MSFFSSFALIARLFIIGGAASIAVLGYLMSTMFADHDVSGTHPRTLYLLASTLLPLAFLPAKWLNDYYERMINCDLKTLLATAFITYAAIHLTSDLTSVRAILACIFLCHLWYAWSYKLVIFMKDQDAQNRIATGFLVLMLTAAVLPGFYIPPFYDGIPGWILQQGEDKTRSHATGLKLVRKDGEEIWFSNALINPISLMWRQISSVDPKDKVRFGEYMDYLYNVYKYWYPKTLYKGELPNGLYFGDYGYPGHNAYDKTDYSAYPPEDIAYIDYVTVTYDRIEKKEIENYIRTRYDVHSRTFIPMNKQSEGEE
jgi:hypothetical protein